MGGCRSPPRHVHELSVRRLRISRGRPAGLRRSMPIVTALPRRGMTAPALKEYFARHDSLTPLADAVDASVGSDVLFGALSCCTVSELQPFFASGTSWRLLLDLEKDLRQVMKFEMLQHAWQHAEVQLEVLRSELSQLEYAVHKAHAAACGAQLLMHEERDKLELHLASRERALAAETAGRKKAQFSAEVDRKKAKEAQQTARRDVEAAQLKAKVAERAAEAKCESKLREMRERLDSMQVRLDAEAARAGAAAARAEVAETRAAEAEAKLSTKQEAEVQAAVSFMLAPGEIMAAAAKLRAVEWAAALDKSSSTLPSA